MNIRRMEGKRKGRSAGIWIWNSEWISSSHKNGQGETENHHKTVSHRPSTINHEPMVRTYLVIISIADLFSIHLMSLCFFIVYHSTCILLICFIVNRFIGSSFPSFFIGGFRPFSRSSRPFFTAMISVALIRSFAYAALWIFLGILLHTRGPKNRLSVGPNSLAHAIDRFLCFQFLIFYLFFYFVFLSFLSLLSLLSPLSFDFSQKSWIIIVIMLLLMMMMIVIYCYFLHSCCCCCCCHFALFVVFFYIFTSTTKRPMTRENISKKSQRIPPPTPPPSPPPPPALPPLSPPPEKSSREIFASVNTELMNSEFRSLSFSRNETKGRKKRTGKRMQKTDRQTDRQTDGKK